MLDQVKVPVENVLGIVGEGHKVAFNILNLGRVKLGTRNMAGSRQALEQATKYAKERRQFGKAIAEFGLIRQKLAEMSIRCYVGDAMVYRALGDVDRALESVGQTDSAGVLKTIERFAVECSINKVFTSEALAYVVDEAIQVFGGNGYSREFPVERAYRDARITRIYEGTNEINRLIIPTRLLKQGVFDSQDSPHSHRSSGSSALGAEWALLGQAKRLAIRLLREAQSAYGESLKLEQEVLGHSADVIIDVYALESALARTDKLAGARGAAAAASAVDSVRVFAGDAADRMVHAARQVLRALASRSQGAGLAAEIAPIGNFAGVDAVAARRRIADAVVAAGKHPF
jgi:hypothetical protein